MPFDPLYLLFVLPGLVLAMIATVLTQTTFGRYSRIAAASGLSGAEAARQLLEENGIHDVEVRMTGGFLSDHYNPVNRTLNLSPSVYRSGSLAAIGVACHEAGHAIQHATGYGPLALRTALVPAMQIGNNISYLLIILGMLTGMLALAKVGVILFGLAVLFSVITLPVEWDASARAKRLMVSSGIVTPAEREHAGQVLNAAFMTYVAAAVTSLLTLLYYLFRLGLIGGRRD